jgi:DNA-binding CsgD family transcriptional regulator
MTNQTTKPTTKTLLTADVSTRQATAKRKPLTADEINNLLAYVHRIAKPQTNEKTEKITIRPDLYAIRNESRQFKPLTENGEFQESCLELLNTIAITATYKTLQYLVSHGATYTETADNIDRKKDDVSPMGYNMAVKLLQDLPQDLATLRTNNTETALADSVDLYQEVRTALFPFIYADIEIDTDTVIYTKILKNGNEKDYTLFSFACLTVRRYIQGYAQKQYKKLAHIIGYTDEGKPVYSTKKQAVNLSEIDESTKANFIKRLHLTAFEESVLKLYLDGNTTEEIATAQSISLRTAQHHLKTAKDKIRKQYKMI